MLAVRADRERSEPGREWKHSEGPDSEEESGAERRIRADRERSEPGREWKHSEGPDSEEESGAERRIRAEGERSEPGALKLGIIVRVRRGGSGASQLGQLE